jgi:hypothetical protein
MTLVGQSQQPNRRLRTLVTHKVSSIVIYVRNCGGVASGDVWTLDHKVEDKLRQLVARADKFKMMQRALQEGSPP